MPLTLDKLTSFAKSRGFVFPSSEIYGGFAAVYDYGPLGTKLKDNLAAAWKRDLIDRHPEIYGLDAGIFMAPRVWEASGHVGGFSDPLVEDKKSHRRFRADHVLESFGIEIDDKSPAAELDAAIEKIVAENPDAEFDGAKLRDFTKVRAFNLLVKSNLGTTDGTMTDENVVYPRGETCQGIYVNFKNVMDAMRARVPFGIAQVGKAFRNEIVARQWVFRTREFEQMEFQYFVHPDDEMQLWEEWREKRLAWHRDVIGLDADRLRTKPHEKLAHYARAATDIEFRFDALGGFKELEGIHARGDWDLGRHTEFSGTKLDYFDEARGERFTPHVVETACGLSRLVVAVLENFYREEMLENGDTRTVLKFPAWMAPTKVAILPLSKKENLIAKSREIFDRISGKFACDFDTTASIGKRYRRQDEVGTPLCVTVDFGTLGEDDAQGAAETVTVRERDSMAQTRIPLADLEKFLAEKLG